MPIIEIARIQVRRGQERQTGIPLLAPGEFAWAEDTQNLYIGRAQAEGANSDGNTRVLTEFDLGTLFNYAAQASLAVNGLTTSSYRFRNDIIPESLASTTGTIYTKLDNWVSITDFSPTGMWPPHATSGNPYPDITTSVLNAIGYLSPAGAGHGVVFSNPTDLMTGATLSTFSIKIPAGNWVTTATVYLPPNVKLIGEGAGLTNITYMGTDPWPMFQTVDAIGHKFDTGNMAFANGQNSNNVTLKGMSLLASVPNMNYILSLDNTANAVIDDVNFGDSVSTSTTGLTGIRLRTYQGVSADPTNRFKYSSNIQITNSKFNGLDVAIVNTGTVNRIIVENSKFSWMNNSFVSYTNTPTAPGVIGALFENNIFENIASSALVVGTASNPAASFLISTKNIYRDVGNNFQGESTQTAYVITAFDTGCQSIDDYFDRQYNTVLRSKQIASVSGNMSVKSGATRFVNIGSPAPASVLNTTSNIINIPMTPTPQMATIDYKLTNPNMIRTGQLIMNISTAGTYTNPDGFASVSDYYNYAENTLAPGSSSQLIFSTDMSHSVSVYTLKNIYTSPYAITINTVTNTSTVTANIVSPVFTSTFITTGTTFVTFDTSTQAFGTSNTATIQSYTLTGTILNVTLSSVVTNPVLPGTCMILWNPPATSWSSSTNNTFFYPVGTDINISQFATGNVSSATISINNISSSTFSITGTQAVTTVTNGTTSTIGFNLFFTATNAVVTGSTIVQPTDIANVTIYPNFYNCVGLTCYSADTSLNTWTTMEYTIDLLT